MRVKVESVGQGLHPNESVIAVTTTSGTVRLTVDSRALKSGSLEVGNPVGSDGGNLLVELPRETTTGSWRVWVPEGQLEAA